MDKEELEKEAEIFVSEKADKGNFDVEKFGKAYFSESSMKQALVKFAEKQIAELENELLYMKKSKVALQNVGWEEAFELFAQQEKRIAELEKENEKLKRKTRGNDLLMSTVEKLTKSKIELEETLMESRMIAKTNMECWKQSASKLDDAIKIMKEIEAADLMKVVEKAEQYLAIEKLQNFLKELE